LNITKLNDFRLSLGDDFAQGAMSGTLQVGGAIFGTLKGAGIDPIAGHVQLRKKAHAIAGGKRL
jgi:hypothetical protein